MIEVRCMQEGCMANARVAPRLHLPQTGALGLNKAGALFCNLLLCQAHAQVLTAGQMMTPEFKDVVEAKAAAEGMAIDFGQAWLTAPRIYSHDFEGYLDFLAGTPASG